MGSEISLLESIVPTPDVALHALLLSILFVAFFLIVVISKKYRYLFDYIERFF